MFNEYPMLLGEIREIEFCDDIGEDVARACISKRLVMRLKLNKKIFANEELLNQLLENSLPNISKKDGLQGYMKHEFTHFLEYRYAIKKNTKNGIVNKKKAFEEINQSVYATEILKDALSACNLQYNNAIIKTISSYATYDNSEAIAEAVSYCDNDSKLCETIKKLVKRKWG